MLSLTRCDFLVPLFLALITCAAAQSSSASSSSCGSDITGYGLFYTIKFNSYCQQRLFSTNLTLPVKKSTFKDCATTCVAQGKSCGGFAFDRSSHYSENNCYLNTPTALFQKGTSEEGVYFDSAAVDNTSLPVVRTDCGTTGQNGVYQGYNLHCGTTIQNEADPSQISTIFAASLSDCIEHCKNTTQSTGSPLCYAVTWDPTTLHGYENCYLKASNFIQPTINALWDSATLVGAIGRNPPVSSTSSASSSTSSSSSTATSATSSPSTSLSSSATASPQGPQQPTPNLSTSGIAGIAVCSALALLILLASIFWFFRRRRNMREAEQTEATAAAQATSEPQAQWRRELSGRGLVEKPDDSVRVHELESEARSPRSELFVG